MSEITLTATTGRPTGSSASRRLRAEGRVPATVYGEGGEPISVSVDYRELRRTLSTDAGQNALITLSVDGDTFATVVKDLQRHPVRRDVAHVDFLKVDVTAPIEVEVPIHMVGEDKEVTVNGGLTELRLTALRVLVRPDQIPDGIEVDISDMTLDMVIHAGDLTLPAGSELVTDATEAIVTAELTRAALTESEEEALEGEGTDGADASTDGDSGGSDSDSSE